MQTARRLAAVAAAFSEHIIQLLRSKHEEWKY